MMSIFTVILTIGLLVAFVVMAISLVGLIVRWKTPKRRGHAIRLFASFIAIPCIYGIHFANLFLVELPALGRQQRAARDERLAESSMVQVGDAVPPFSMTTVDGDEFSIPDVGNVVIINFFATWCGPCQLELPHIEKIWTANKDNEHFRLLVIGREESKETVQKYRDENNFSFPIAADPNRDVYSLFAKELIPRTFVVSPNGQIVYSTTGFYENEIDELNAVLREQFGRLK